MTTQIKPAGNLVIQNPDCLDDILSGRDRDALEIDLSALEIFDSVALAALLNLIRNFDARNGDLKFIHCPKNLITLAKSYNINELIEPYCSN